MKKRILILLFVMLAMFNLTGCDNTDDKEKIINITCWSHYFNTTETWDIDTHNGYKAMEVDKQYDKESDTYTITFVFGRPFRETGLEEMEK